MFFDILKVGAISVFSPLQSVVTVTILTSMLARFGTEVLAGYGIGTRLEFMLTSIAFAVGVSATPMVGMAVGANRVARARRVAWTAAAVAFVSLGLIGTLLSVFPDLWVSMFTDDPAVRDAGRRYLHISSPMMGFVGLNMALYFSSQGAAKIIGPVLVADRPADVHRRRRYVADLDQRVRYQLLHPRRRLDGDAGPDDGVGRAADLVGAASCKSCKRPEVTPAPTLSHRSHDELRAGTALPFCMMIIIFKSAADDARGRNER